MILDANDQPLKFNDKVKFPRRIKGYIYGRVKHSDLEPELIFVQFGKYFVEYPTGWLEKVS